MILITHGGLMFDVVEQNWTFSLRHFWSLMRMAVKINFRYKICNPFKFFIVIIRNSYVASCTEFKYNLVFTRPNIKK